jgi:8-oxo-dGTP pyrophosphatase MutT (NUDIX family)
MRRPSVGVTALAPTQFKSQLRALLASRQRRVLAESGLMCSAVLVPLLFKNGEWHVLVTQRSQHVAHHKGQISFPGGACETGDAGYVATALRETCEEIGVPAADVEVLGALDDYRTISSFVVTPVVGVIPPAFDYRLNGCEVEAVVEVPLSYLCDPSRLRTEMREHEGQVFDVLFWDYGAYVIWGATAQILKGLLDLLD